MMIKIAHLYPDMLNLYGDRGNIIALTKRMELRGISTQVDKLLWVNPLMPTITIFYLSAAVRTLSRTFCLRT